MKKRTLQTEVNFPGFYTRKCQKGVYQSLVYTSLNHFVQPESSHKSKNGRNAKFKDIIIHVNFHVVVHFH